MFVIQNLVAAAGVAVLTADVGEVGQTAIDDETNDRYVKLGNAWTKVADGTGRSVAAPLMGEVTIHNAAGTVSRKLTAVNGAVTLAGTDALVSSDDVVSVDNFTGSIVKSGVLTVADGAVSRVRLGYSDTLVSNQDVVRLALTGSADPNDAARIWVSKGTVMYADETVMQHVGNVAPPVGIVLQGKEDGTF